MIGDAFYRGATPVDKIYLGASLVWEPDSGSEPPPLPPLGSSVTDNSTVDAKILVITNDAYATPITTDDAVTVATQTPVEAGALVETVDETPLTTTDTVTVVLT